MYFTCNLNLFDFSLQPLVGPAALETFALGLIQEFNSYNSLIRLLQNVFQLVNNFCYSSPRGFQRYLSVVDPRGLQCHFHLYQT